MTRESEYWDSVWNVKRADEMSWFQSDSQP